MLQSILSILSKQKPKDIFEAARNCDITTIECLLETGAGPNSMDKNGFTPLHFSARYGQTDAIKTLINAGADCKAKTKHGNTPFDLINKNNPIYGTDAYRRLNDSKRHLLITNIERKTIMDRINYTVNTTEEKVTQTETWGEWKGGIVSFNNDSQGHVAIAGARIIIQNRYAGVPVNDPRNQDKIKMKITDSISEINDDRYRIRDAPDPLAKAKAAVKILHSQGFTVTDDQLSQAGMTRSDLSS